MKILLLFVVVSVVILAWLPLSHCSKKPVGVAKKEDIPYIKCEVCELLAKQLHQQVQNKQTEISPKKISELQIIEIAENVCNLKKVEADWILRIDIVEKGDKLELVEHDSEGQCNSECKTIERACQDVIGYSDTDVAEYLYSNKPDADSLFKYLCKDLTKSCITKPPPVPKLVMALEIEQHVELSNVAVSDTHGEDSPYFAGWKAYDENPYDEFTNPSGVIQMGLAENQVSFDLLEKYLEEHSEASTWGKGAPGFRENALFQDYHGLKSFRTAMASFMGQIRGGRSKFDPDRVVLTAGATAANELLTFILANPGDSLLVPTPYYPGFDRDLRWRTGVNIVPIHCDSSNNFQITEQALEAAYKDVESMNRKVRGILITNPSNPLGVTIQRHVLEMLLDFVTRKNIHLVSDEIYSGSTFSSSEFISVAEILESRNYKNAERVHIVYSLSKDLGLPGFRVGTIYSYNDKVVTTARRMSSFTLISSQTQHLLASMLSDKSFTENYIRTNRERLKRRYQMIIEGLKSVGIACLKGNAGLFCWMNLSPLLNKRNREGELELWNEILHEVKLNISPGSSCHCSESGWFRVCFANMSEQTLEIALERIRKFMLRMRR